MAATRKTMMLASKQTTANIDPGLRLQTLSCSVGYLLRRAQLSAFTAFDESVGRMGIRPAHYAVLTLIRDNPGLTQSAVSNALGIQKANLVALLDSFEHSGWTERRRAEGDRRSFALHLTRAGERFTRKLETVHTRMETRLEQRLGIKQTARLRAMLQKFARPD